MSTEELDDSVHARKAPLLAFLYGDALVEEIKSDNNIVGPAETVRLSYKAESLMIQDKIRESGRKIKFWSAPATVENLKARLDYGCKILHFTGHGLADYLAFEKTGCCGATEPLKVDDLYDIFKAVPNKPDLVFIGSCESEECGQAVANAGVPHVVAVKACEEVPDAAAQQFCKTLYHALIAGNRTIQQAFDAAFSLVAIEEPEAAAMFLLLPTSKDHNVTIFNDLPRGAFEDKTPMLPPICSLLSPRPTYQGGVELKRVISLLEDTDIDCVTITGRPGIGKTEMALQACHYMRERDLVCAIFFAHCRDIVAQNYPLPSSEGRCARVERLCQLVGSALGMSPAASSPSGLWEFLLDSTVKMINQYPIKILLVVDAADAFCESGEKEARASLAHFVDKLCGTDARLKILVTSDKAILERTDQYLSSSTEGVHPVKNLGRVELAKLLLSLFPSDCRRSFADKIGLDKDACYEDVKQALEEHNLLKSVKGNPGVLCQIAPLLRRKQFLSDHTVEETAVKCLKQMEYKSKNKYWDRKRSHQISLEEGLEDNRCKDIWSQATSGAASDDHGFGEKDDACYLFVRWSDLSMALERTLCQVQTTSSGVGRSMSSEDRLKSEGNSSSSGSRNSSYWAVSWQSQGYGFDSTFRARGLDDSELNFIREVLRKYSSNDENLVDNRGRETGEEKGNLFTVYASAGCMSEKGDGNDEVFSLKTFARFSKSWLVPVIATMSRMRQEWAEIEPIKVHGFVSRKETKRQLLETGLPGVFLLRFSETHKGCFILSSTFKPDGTMANTRHSGSRLDVKELLVTVQEDGRWKLCYNKNAKYGNTYGSLSKLVLETPSLSQLYSSISKETVFSTSPTTDFNTSIMVNGD